MSLDDETNHNKVKDLVVSSVHHQSSESMSTTIQQQQPTQPPPRRDKFASMAAATAAETSTTVVGEGDRSPNHRTTATQRNTADGNDKDAAARMQTQGEDQTPQGQHYVDLCTQRDAVWEDCDTAEHAVTDLLKYAEQTTMLLAKNTTSGIDSDVYVQSKEQLSQLINEYQSTVGQVHDLLAKHAHHVQAYKSNVQRQGEAMTTSSSNSLYTQSVELRLAETKRRLIQDIVTSMNDEPNVPKTSINSDT